MKDKKEKKNKKKKNKNITVASDDNFVVINDNEQIDDIDYNAEIEVVNENEENDEVINEKVEKNTNKVENYMVPVHKTTIEKLPDNYALVPVNKVVDQEEDEETADHLRAGLIFLGCSALAASIILGSLAYVNYHKENQTNTKSTYEDDVNKNIDVNDNISKETNEETNEETTTQTTTEDVENNEEVYEPEVKEVNYNNVGTFYNHIIDNRNKYGKFAESFQTEEDVKNFINFVYQFNDFYSECDLNTTITTKDQFDSIIADYYSSCANHGIEGQLSTIFENISDYKTNLSESEKLAADLKNGVGNDFTIANNYYTWFGKKLCDDRTAIDSTRANAPLIEILRWQYEQYRYAGNMLNARRYQKNDSLPINSYSIYYAEVAPEGVEVIETENSFSCPDWGIDNVVSPTEEDTEKKLVIKETADSLFYRVQESFNDITQNNKTRGL